MKARKEGMLSLEDDVERIADPFLQRALALAIDGTDVDDAAGDARGRDHARREEPKKGRRACSRRPAATRRRSASSAPCSA